MEKIISIDLKADFGFFRKPDTNDGINFTYNMMHKPALLGLLGAIVGLEGYKKLGEVPEYYKKLKDLKIGIEPLGHEKGNYNKTVIKYSNTVGYANAGSNYLTEESTLIAPAYRCYILLDMDDGIHEKLYTYLRNGEAEFIPYFGKNEFYAWWNNGGENIREYEFEAKPEIGDAFRISTLFRKREYKIKDQKEDDIFDLFGLENEQNPYIFFERLPVGFDDTLYQYEIANFVYTTFNLKSNIQIEGLYYLKNNGTYVQLY